MFLCALQRRYKTPGLEPTTLTFLCCSAPDDYKDFKYSLIRFSWFTVKFSKPFLVSTFSKFSLITKK